MRHTTLTLGCVLLLSACPPVSGVVPPSPHNGIWATQPGDAGIVVFDLPDGAVVWSPLTLPLQGGLLTLKHGCRDFQVDPSSGVVAQIPGVRWAGAVRPSAAGFEFSWDAPTLGLLSAHNEYVGDGGSAAAAHGLTLLGSYSDGGITLVIEWLLPDAGVQSRERVEFAAARIVNCPP